VFECAAVGRGPSRLSPRLRPLPFRLRLFLPPTASPQSAHYPPDATAEVFAPPLTRGDHTQVSVSPGSTRPLRRRSSKPHSL